MLIDHAIHPFRKNRVLSLEEVVARISPLPDRFFDELPCNNKWIVIGKLPRLRSTSFLSSWWAKAKRSHLLERQFHDVVHMNGGLIRAQQCFLGSEERGWIVVHPLPRFIRTEVWSSVSNGVSELGVKGPDGLVDSPLVRRAFNVSRQGPRKSRDQLDNLSDRVLGRWFRKFVEGKLRISEETL